MDRPILTPRSPAVKNNMNGDLELHIGTHRKPKPRPSNILIKSSSRNSLTSHSLHRSESTGTPRRSQSTIPSSPRARSPSAGPQSPRSPGLGPQTPRSPSPSLSQQRFRSSTPSLLESLLRRTRNSWGYDGGTSKLESSVKLLRSSSFLQKAREAQERERSRLGIQDDTLVQKDSSTRMKQKPRRIESFHGSRSRSQHQHHHKEPSPSISSSTDASLHSYHTVDSKEVKEGTSKQYDSGNSQLPMEQVTTPTTKVKEWPTMADLSQQRQKQHNSNHGYFNSNLSPSKSSPNLDKEEAYNTRTVNYSSPLMNKSSPNIHDDVRKSSSSSLNTSNQKWSSPSAYHKSPKPYCNFYPASSYSKHNSNDYQNLQEIQQSINQSPSHGLPPPIEKEECEPELQGLTKGDNRPLCSPPAPPTRDISSLKYVPLTSQSHAKYPSWPVTQPSADTESGEPINAPLSIYNEHNANQNNVRSLKDRNSPNSDRKASDRNASDPGFKKPIPFAVFLKRPDQKHVEFGGQLENKKKDNNAKMDEFFDSLPGYQQPIFDQDGHRIGDEKYNVSPPERESDGRNPSRRSNHKQDSRYVLQYKGYAEPRVIRDSGSNPILSPDRDSKSSYGNSLIDKTSLQVSTDNKFTDSSTSPMQSPKQSKLPGSKEHVQDIPPSNDPKMHSYIVNKKTMVCFNTGTQTEFNTPKKKSPVSPGFNSHFVFDKSHQAIQTSPESTNRDDDVHKHLKPKEGHESRTRPKSTSEKDKLLLNNINSELDSNDQHSAPFMRKLARDLLANQNNEHKRRSTSSSGGSGLRSPSSDYSHYFGELKESESYSSVIIHDDISEADTITSSRPDGGYDKSKSARRSLDPSMFTQKLNRSLQGSRYGSEAQLSSHSTKEYATSMTNLSYSAREDSRHRTSRPSTDSSTPSHRTGSSTDTFSSTGTHYSFDNTQSPFVPSPGHVSGRRESNDSVFTEDKSPFEKKGDNFKDFKSSSNEKRKSQNWVGRTQSMKKAYGTYDETQMWHKRQESDGSSASSGDNHNVIHGRSQSDYLPMDAIRKHSDKLLGAINEESSEARWQDALRKSQRSSQSSFDSDLDVKKHVNEKLREYQTKTEMERTNLKRTSSEQIRPMKEKLGSKTQSETKLEDTTLQSRKDAANLQRINSRERLSPAQSQSDLHSQSGSDSFKLNSGRMISPSSSRSDLQQEQDNRKPPSPSHTDLQGSREDLKRVQKSALQNFMLSKTGRLPSDEEQTPSPNDQIQNIPERPTRLTVTESFRKKYAEGDKLRRSRSISSTDSGNYTEMRPPVRPSQTEWSRVRSQTRRPLSIGSDSGSSLVDPYAVTPITSSSLEHSRTPSDSLESPRVEQGTRDSQSSRDTTPLSPRMGSSSIYQNLMQEHSGYRKPLPPPPPTDDDKPPELPPRNYRKDASQSDSQLLPPRQAYQQPPQEESHEKYVEQLRKFSRRYSEQQSAAAMMYLSSKQPPTHVTQSYPKPEVKAFEATQPQVATSPNTHESPKLPAHHSSQVNNVSPSFSNHSPSSSSYDVRGEKHETRQRPPSPRHSPTVRHANHCLSPTDRQPSPQQSSSTRQISPHHSPQSSILRQIGSPDPPPPPTPMKDGVEYDQELPPPPPEVMQEKDQVNERFSDDSYLSHKTKGDTRPIGQYNRSATSSDVTKVSPETNNNKVEKPPRKRLQKVWQPPTNQAEQNNDQSSVPRFSAAESRVNPNVIKSVAKPLDKNHVQPRPLGSSCSASALLTPRPFMATKEQQKESQSAERPSVRDAISCYESKSTPDRPERFTASKYPSSSQFNNSRTSNDRVDFNATSDSVRRLSHDNLKQNTDNFNTSVQDGVSRLTFESDPMSPRRTSFPPDRHKINLIGKYGDDPKEDKKQIPHSEYNGNITLPENLHSNSYISSSDRSNLHHRSNEHDIRSHSNSHMSFNPSPEQFSDNSVKDQEIQSCHVRQRSQEELECDEKVSEIVKKDETLKQVLQVDNKGRMDFMNGIFPMEEPVRHHQSPRHSPQSSTVREGDEVNRQKEQKSPLDPSSLPAGYFKSSPKAKIEMDMREKSDEFNQEKEIKDPDTLIKTKEELVRSIQKKVEKLKEGKNELQKELDEVDDMGRKVVKLVQEKCRTQQEKDKFGSYITDMEKIIKLLLKLSGLLARAENALQSLPENSSPSVKKMAVDKRDRLQEQHEEAKSLKEDIDKRSAQVAIFLQECLSEAEFEDYKYFVQMKSKLTIEMQEFDDKITLGQEQILGLKRNIPGK